MKGMWDGDWRLNLRASGSDSKYCSGFISCGGREGGREREREREREGEGEREREMVQYICFSPFTHTTLLALSPCIPGVALVGR